MKTKELIRQEMTIRRNFLPLNDVWVKSKKICDRIIAEEVYQKADAILLFSSFRNEVETIFLQKDAFEKKKKVFYPKIIGNDMFFYQIEAAAELTKGYMGILEPIENKYLFEYKGEKVLVIVPGLAFDKAGNRLGYGKGYYDRFLQTNRNLQTIAPAYELQIIQNIKVDCYDQKISCIITEENKYCIH